MSKKHDVVKDIPIKLKNNREKRPSRKRWRRKPKPRWRRSWESQRLPPKWKKKRRFQWSQDLKPRVENPRHARSVFLLVDRHIHYHCSLLYLCQGVFSRLAGLIYSLHHVS